MWILICSKRKPNPRPIDHLKNKPKKGTPELRGARLTSVLLISNGFISSRSFALRPRVMIMFYDLYALPPWVSWQHHLENFCYRKEGVFTEDGNTLNELRAVSVRKLSETNPINWISSDRFIRTLSFISVYGQWQFGIDTVQFIGS